ncbi:type II toxin-antitoxin system RelE/ParE family toxin [Rhizobium sp. FKL33]|uniref:type II toxin-antitoxin system RelE/ParE family toxin n=1 Tax=Rhizobium sp. FKL33 TaxID=2562307 RepID=UPI0010C13E61|nr:type II toxin-antitoxin system RelE/ParE family toxin [Rhizobium sp. FKL33]
MRVIWLEQAEYELDSQINFIAQHNPQAAVTQDILIQQATERLSTFPMLGRAGRLRHTRELVVPQTPFIAIYRLSPSGDEIHILRLLHAAQKWPPE